MINTIVTGFVPHALNETFGKFYPDTTAVKYTAYHLHVYRRGKWRYLEDHSRSDGKLKNKGDQLGASGERWRIIEGATGRVVDHNTIVNSATPPWVTMVFVGTSNLRWAKPEERPEGWPAGIPKEEGVAV